MKLYVNDVNSLSQTGHGFREATSEEVLSYLRDQLVAAEVARSGIAPGSNIINDHDLLAEVEETGLSIRARVVGTSTRITITASQWIEKNWRLANGQKKKDRKVELYRTQSYGGVPVTKRVETAPELGDDQLARSGRTLCSCGDYLLKPGATVSTVHGDLRHTVESCD